MGSDSVLGESRDLEASFQLADLQADGGLCELEPFGGGGEAAAFNHNDEGLKLVIALPVPAEAAANGVAQGLLLLDAGVQSGLWPNASG